MEANAYRCLLLAMQCFSFFFSVPSHRFSYLLQYLLTYPIIFSCTYHIFLMMCVFVAINSLLLLPGVVENMMVPSLVQTDLFEKNIYYIRILDTMQTLCEIFVPKTVIWGYNCLLRIIKITRYLKPYNYANKWLFLDRNIYLRAHNYVLYVGILKTQKMVLDASLFNTQHYKVQIKGKVEQSREGVAPSSTPWCSSYRKGSLRVTLDYGCQLYLLICRHIIFVSYITVCKQIIIIWKN